jgi:hypothetical protein
VRLVWRGKNKQGWGNGVPTPLGRRQYMGTLPTVKVQAETKSGFMSINESDFDKRVHKLYKEPEEKKPEVIQGPEVKPEVKEEKELESEKKPEKEPAITRSKKVKEVK